MRSNFSLLYLDLTLLLSEGAGLGALLDEAWNCEWTTAGWLGLGRIGTLEADEVDFVALLGLLVEGVEFVALIGPLVEGPPLLFIFWSIRGLPCDFG